jgi:hypothetical protein
MSVPCIPSSMSSNQCSECGTIILGPDPPKIGGLILFVYTTRNLLIEKYFLDLAESTFKFTDEISFVFCGGSSFNLLTNFSFHIFSDLNRDTDPSNNYPVRIRPIDLYPCGSRSTALVPSFFLCNSKFTYIFLSCFISCNLVKIFTSTR